MMTATRWPNAAKAAISFTMDNLGEAQDVNKGLWPVGEAYGSHYSVKEQLPRMLNMLDEHAIKATYFAESWSLGVYPDIVKDMTRRGHEIAWHGYQHETWSMLSAEDEKLNFQRSFDAATEFGVTYDGFRPPGGSINNSTYDLLRRQGCIYVSPLGELGINRGIVVLPFEWRTVDAFYYMDKFASIRESHGEQNGVLAPHDFKEYLLAKIAQVVESQGYISILFHPFLQTSEEKLSVMEQVLDRISSDPDIWCAPCNQVARWVGGHPSIFGAGQS
jgi:peptidoglycan/xylan/chitin deacetylase (PgdA/CDA1 family)